MGPFDPKSEGFSIAPALCACYNNMDCKYQQRGSEG